MIYRENPNFVAREIQPNPREVSYWIDLSESPQGQIIKTWVSGKWVKINPSDAEQGGVDLTEVKQAIANLQTNKADKQEVQEVKDQLNEIDLSDYITTTEADSKYQVKGNYALKTDIPETDDFITKDEADTTYQEKGYYLTSIPGEYVTETELLAKGYATTSQIPDISTKQDKLVSGTNIKTINNQSVLGQGNIDITTGTGGITDAPSDGTIYGRQNGNWVEVNVDTSDLATKEELESKMDVEGGEFTGTVAVPTLALMYSSQGMMYQIQSAQRETTFRTMNAGQDTVNFMVQYSTPLKLTEAGIWENGMLLENKYALLDDIPTIPTNVSTFTNDAGYITSDDLTGYATTEQLNLKQDTLVSGTNIKTVNGVSILGSGNITIETPEGGITDAPADGNMYGRKDSTWQQIVMPDISALATKEELLSKADTEDVESKLDKSTYNADKPTFALKSEIPTDYLTSEDLPDTSNLATKQEVQAKQDILISGTNIKTINGASVLGEGNITIETPEGGISDAPQDGKTYGRKDRQWSEITIPDTSALATKTEIADMATQTWVGEQGYLTEHQDISNLATKEELASKANTSDLSNYLTAANASTIYETISGAQSKYQPVGEYALKSEIPSLSGYATESYVNTQISNLVNSAPEALNTLDELAAALNDDSNFATTVTNQIAAKLDITTYTSDKETFALKTELSSKADSSALANYLTTATAESTYAKKSEIPQQSLLPYDFFGEVEYTQASGGTDTITISGDKYSTYCIGSGTVNVTFGTLITGVEYHLLVRSNAGTITLGIPDLGAKYEVFVIGDKTQFTIEDNSILEMSFMLYGSLIVCRVSEPSSYTIAYNNTSGGEDTFG